MSFLQIRMWNPCEGAMPVLSSMCFIKALFHLDKFYIGPSTHILGFIAETTNKIAKLLLKLSIKMQDMGLVYKYPLPHFNAEKVKCPCLNQNFLYLKSAWKNTQYFEIEESLYVRGNLNCKTVIGTEKCSCAVLVRSNRYSKLSRSRVGINVIIIRAWKAM